MGLFHNVSNEFAWTWTQHYIIIHEFGIETSHWPCLLRKPKFAQCASNDMFLLLFQSANSPKKKSLWKICNLNLFLRILRRGVWCFRGCGHSEFLAHDFWSSTVHTVVHSDRFTGRLVKLSEFTSTLKARFGLAGSQEEYLKLPEITFIFLGPFDCIVIIVLRLWSEMFRRIQHLNKADLKKKKHKLVKILRT